MRRIYFYLIFIILFIFSACSSSKKAYKKAQEFEASGLYVESAEQDLKALREKPDFIEALVHLKSVAPKAYDELINRAENYEAAENWDPAVREYERIQGLLRRFARYGVVFKTVNIKQRLLHTKREAAKYHYSNAEAFFSTKNWQKAGLAYLKAHDSIENYNNSFEKAIQSFLNSGDRWLAEKNFSNALTAYHKVLDIAPNHSKATGKIAESHYQAGKQYFKEERYREALEQFEKTQKIIEEYKDTTDWVQRAFDNAVQYVGVFPFQNLSEYTVDGYFIASGILNRVIHANIRFAEFLSEANMNALLNKLRSKKQNRILEVELLKLANDEGLNSIVWGNVRKVNVKDKPESFTEFKYEKTIAVKDSAGKEVKETEPIFYREYTKSRTVRIYVDYFILESETGKYLYRQRLEEDLNDVAHWIAYQGSIYDLPENKRYLIDAPRNPRPLFTLMNELLDSISNKISREVIRFYE